MSRKMAFYTPPYPRVKSYYDMVDLAVEYGHDTIEAFSQFEFETPDVAAAKKLKAYADSKGIGVCCFSVYIELEKGDLREKIDRLKGYAEVTRALGCPYLHHTVVAEYAEPDNVLPRKDALFDAGVAAIREVYDYAKSLGVKAIYEPQGYLFNGVDGVARLLEEVGRDIRLVADFGNIQQGGDTILDFVNAFADKVAHVHLKDVYITPTDVYGGGLKTLDGQYMTEAVPGRGCVPLQAGIALLKEKGYDGYYSLEFAVKDDASPVIDETFAMFDQWL